MKIIVLLALVALTFQARADSPVGGCLPVEPPPVVDDSEAPPR
jgi:hypothetical protein